MLLEISLTRLFFSEAEDYKEGTCHLEIHWFLKKSQVFEKWQHSKLGGGPSNTPRNSPFHFSFTLMQCCMVVHPNHNLAISALYLRKQSISNNWEKHTVLDSAYHCYFSLCRFWWFAICVHLVAGWGLALISKDHPTFKTTDMNSK